MGARKTTFMRGGGERPPKHNPKRSNVYIRNVRRDLFLAFKAWCIRRDVSIKDKFEEMVRELLRKDITK